MTQAEERICALCPSYKNDYCGRIKRGLQHECERLATMKVGYDHAEKKAERWLRDIYSQFDITDTNGYAIDIDTMVCKFRQAMTE